MTLARRIAALLLGALLVGVGLVGCTTQDQQDSSRPASGVAGSTPTASAATGQPGEDPGTQAETDPKTDPESGLAWISVEDLPAEASETLELIDAGGPFPYPRDDGKTFGNYEGLLPDQPRGYYREYTVPTPGSDDRGARRIVVGREGECYWTHDHYATFNRIERTPR